MIRTGMHIPFSPPDITEAEIQQVADVLRSGWITTGPKTKELERKKMCIRDSDKGELYIITGITDGYVALSDGRLKPVDHPKQKKPMHIAKKADIPALLAEKLTQGMPLTNEDIKRVIKLWRSENV